MATPLEVLKARRDATERQLQGMLQSQGGYGDRIGRSLVTLGAALGGAFTDPNVKAFEEYQQAQPTLDAAAQRSADVQSGAFGGMTQTVGGQALPEDPRAVERYSNQQQEQLMQGMSPEMRQAVIDKREESQVGQAIKGANPTQEGYMNLAKTLYGMGRTKEASEAMAMANSLAPQKGTLTNVAAGGTLVNDRGEIVYQAKQKESAPSLQTVYNADGSVDRSVYIRDGVMPELRQGQYVGNPAGGKKPALFRSAEEEIRINTESKFKEEQAKARAKGSSDREAEDIASGTLVVRAVPVLARSLDLLQSIETGGIDAVLLKGKQILGVESGDEAELVNNMAKNVIKQLKPVFGSQFTAAEGQWLKDIEAGETKSTKGNIRLIQQGINSSRAVAKRALEAAKQSGDLRIAKEMQDFLSSVPEQNINPEPKKPTPQGINEIQSLVDKYSTK